MDSRSDVSRSQGEGKYNFFENFSTVPVCAKTPAVPSDILPRSFSGKTVKADRGALVRAKVVSLATC